MSGKLLVCNPSKQLNSGTWPGYYRRWSKRHKMAFSTSLQRPQEHRAGYPAHRDTEGSKAGFILGRNVPLRCKRLHTVSIAQRSPCFCAERLDRGEKWGRESQEPGRDKAGPFPAETGTMLHDTRFSAALIDCQGTLRVKKTVASPLFTRKRTVSPCLYDSILLLNSSRALAGF